MQVSVIIPVYNAACYLEKAVKSAFYQKETAEIILVEDGSTDNSLKICEKLCSDYEAVKLYRHPDGGNHGAGASRNLGIRKATSEYIGFLDSDDFYLPGRFKEDRRILSERDDIDGVYNALGSDFHTNNQKIIESFENRRFTTMKEVVPPEELFYQMMPIGNKGYFSLDTLTVRRKVFDKVGFFHTELKLAEDTHFLVRLSAVCKLKPGNINEPVAIRIIHDFNRSTQDSLEKYQFFLFKSLFEWGVDNDLSVRKLEFLWEKYFNNYIYYQTTANTWIDLKFQEINFLFSTLLRYPILIKLKAFWSSVPFLGKVLKKIYL